MLGFAPARLQLFGKLEPDLEAPGSLLVSTSLGI